MAAFNAVAIQNKLNAIFNNGTIEAGLEVGADKGLPEDQYIQIPASMKKAWVARVHSTSQDDAVAHGWTTAGAIALWVDGDTIAGKAGQPGWIDHTAAGGSLRITRHEESLWIGDVSIDELHVGSYEVIDLQRFYTVNVGHINDADHDADTQMWIHAVRLWAVMAGMVVTTKSHEWVEVPNPTALHATANQFALFAADYAENALTAVAARTATWRKTNHATGGDILSGFSLRWMRKMGYFPTLTERAAQAAAARLATSAFYIATHAASVHAVLAAMAGADTHHWVAFNPAYGYIDEIDVKDSVRIRISPRTQIAGGALVADSMVVLKMAINDQIAPLISSLDQVPALVAAHTLLDAEGVRCATYARWFLDGHPERVDPVAFSQKDPGFSDLIGELAVIATKYYLQTTISRSPAMQNAVEQLAGDSVKTTWTALGLAKRQLASDRVVEAVRRIRGATSAVAVNALTSADPTIIRAGVAAYNAESARLAVAVGIAAPTDVDPDFVVANAAAQAQATTVAATQGGAVATGGN